MTDLSHLVSEASKAEPFKHHTDPVREKSTKGFFRSIVDFIKSL